MARWGMVILAMALALPAVADEGMWPYNMVPKEELKQKYGFSPSEQWLDNAMLASVRFNNGGSGSFVTPDGLVMTNHHVGADCIQKLSQGDADYMKNGFVAQGRDGELKCPDLELNQLQAIEDVTATVESAARDMPNDAAKEDARKAAKAAMEQACTTETGLRCDVVSLYSGGAYHMYKYKKFTDVRLVFAPEFQAAFFGGDNDNFDFPRMCLDVAFFRAYEGDKPVKSPAFLPFSRRGAQKGDLVFVSGNPGATGRFSTVAELEHLRDVAYPWLLAMLKKERDMLKAHMDKGDAQYKAARDDFFGVENGIKAITGYLQGLTDPAMLAQATSRQAEVQQLVKQKVDPQDQPRLLQAWPRLSEAYKKKSEIYTRYTLLEGRHFAPGGHLASIARHLYRLKTELKKPGGERLREYRDSNLKSLELQLFSEAPIDNELEIEKLTFYLENLVLTLGSNDPAVKAALAGKAPRARATELVQGTRLKDVSVRQSLYQGGEAAHKKANDPMLAYVAALDDAARAVRKRQETEVEAVENSYAGRIAEAWAKVYGKGVYPDATFTLRLNHGEVKGFTEPDGTEVNWRTQMGDLYIKAKREGEKEPYTLAPKWKARMGFVDFTVPFDFISTNDIIGGNSGSPVFNKAGEIVGLIFDGNLHMLPNRFVYRIERGRAVSVHSRAILHALDRVYQAKALAKEIRDARQAPRQ